MTTLNKYLAPTSNFWSTSLNGTINDSVDTITLNSTTGLQAPGYLVLDREDGSGTATPSAREVIYFTGISGSDITGVTRGADGSTARSHSDGALVESTLTVGAWNSLATVLDRAVDDNGYLRAIASPASISEVHIATRLEISGASVVGPGIGINPVFNFIGTLSGPTTFVQTPLVMPQSGSFKWFTFMTRTVASGASSYVDVNVNGTSIFDAGTRPTIAGGGTFASTASIKTKAFSAGDKLTWDYDQTASDGTITDFIIQGRAE